MHLLFFDSLPTIFHPILFPIIRINCQGLTFEDYRNRLLPLSAAFQLLNPVVETAKWVRVRHVK